MKSSPTDKETVRSGRSQRKMLQGDLEAFSGLVKEYAPRMLNLALGIVRRRDAAEDVVQDALVKAYEKLGSWRGEGSLSTWLYRIVYTTAVSSLRRPQGFFEAQGIEEARIAANTAEEEGEWGVTEENIAKMRRALERLSPLDRTLVNLFYIEERSVREVATICGESEGNVKTRLYRARGRLRNLMNGVK